MARWQDPEPVDVPEELRQYAGGHPLVAEALARRGLRTAAAAQSFLHPNSYRPADPGELPGMAAAAARIQRAIERRERICVWGDFDVDGQTATTLLVQTLRKLGGDVFHHIPIRATESHGLNIPRLEQVIDAGARLVLTCDTGIADHAAVDLARRLGVDVVITDHHSLPESLPDAAAVVNPQLLPAGHPLRTLPGVGAAYMLALLLLREAGRGGEAAELLDLVALGIVADLAVQTGDARWLLQRGLEALRSTQRAGLRALYAAAGIDPAAINEETIGFAIGPRLNALGRLGDANPIVDFFLTDDPTDVRVMAERLEGLNRERRHIGEQIFQGALNQLDLDPDLGRHAVLLLAAEGWEPGVIGIVASRLVELHHKPVLLVALDPGGHGRCSARSIEGIDITAAIARHAGLLERYGGHPMAAGLAIRRENIDLFRLRLSETVRGMLGGIELEPVRVVDGYIGLEEISVDLIADLDRLAPFGPGNPALTLVARGLAVRSVRKLGREGEHLRVVVADEAGVVQEVIYWRGEEGRLPQARFDLAFALRRSEFGGVVRPQMVWLDSRPVEGGVDASGDRLRIAIFDHREAAEPEAVLAGLAAQGGFVLWAEGAGAPSAGLRRDQLSRAASLAIWNPPPGMAVLAEALAVVRPETVHLFAVPPADQDLQGFLARLAGLVKHARRSYAGRVSLRQLAGLTAQTEQAVLKGLAWLAAKGACSWSREGDLLALSDPAGTDAESGRRAAVELDVLLRESEANRRYYVRTEKDRLVLDP